MLCLSRPSAGARFAGRPVVQAAFLAVLASVVHAERPPPPSSPRGAPSVAIPGVGAATIATGRRGRQFKLELKAEDRDFVSWLQGKAPQLIAELHERWKRKED